MTASLKGARVLVSGGTGFVGSHLVRRLHGEGAEVHLLVRPTTAPWRLGELVPELSLTLGEIVSPDDVRTVVRAARPEIIVNLAGMRRLDRGIGMIDTSVDVNLRGTLNLAKAVQAENVALRCFLQIGSFEEYGSGPVPFDEEQRERPVSPYSASKVAATQFCQMLYRTLRFPAIVLRSCHLYGPAQDPDMLIPLIIAHCLHDVNFQMRSGDQTRDLGYVGDMVEAFVRAAGCPDAVGEVINVGSGREYRIRDVAEAIVKATGSRARVEVGAVPVRPAEVQRTFGRIDKARRLLGWSPKVDLDDGLRTTIAWYRQAGIGRPEPVRSGGDRR